MGPNRLRQLTSRSGSADGGVPVRSRGSATIAHGSLPSTLPASRGKLSTTVGVRTGNTRSLAEWRGKPLGWSPVGYSTEFLRGVLALIALLAALALLIGAAAELLGLGLFEDGYPGAAGFGGFALRAGVVLVISLGLSAAVERWNG